MVNRKEEEEEKKKHLHEWYYRATLLFHGRGIILQSLIEHLFQINQNF